MPKFSIIIPVYNVEKYIGKCLDSIKCQTYNDYEVIVVNDGTKDNSMDIVKKYDVKIINQENMGLSVARNTGVKNANGEYLLFIDSDDYIESDLLLKLSETLENSPDLVRYQVREVFENSIKYIDYKEKCFKGLNGVDAFNVICNYHFVENAWAYLYKTDFYKKNNFEFKKGAIHEDFGLVPLIIMKSMCVNSIDYIGYNYMQRENSIMSTKDSKKTLKKVSDMYDHYLYLINEINKTSLNSKIFKSFIANSLLIKICELDGKNYREYKKKLKNDKVINNILDDTFIRRLKKLFIKVSPKITRLFTK